MQPRFILKTHTEALRPGNYSILIEKCTSPYGGLYPENVEKKLSKFLSKSVAKYTVLNSTKKNRGFGFLLDNMMWSWKGHVINSIILNSNKMDRINKSEEELEFLRKKYLNKKERERKRKKILNNNKVFDLDKIEKITYLRYFLETEGALFLKLAEQLKNKKEISYSYLKDEIQKIFKEIFEGYIRIAHDFRSRIKIREMLKKTQIQMKNKNHGYASGTLPHKIKPHIQALYDLGLLYMVKDGREEIYKPSMYNGVSPLDILLEKLENFKKMEKIFSNNGYFSLIAKILNLNPVKYSPKIYKEQLKKTFISGYEIMKNKITGMAYIEALINWSCIKLLSEENVLVNRKDIEEFLKEMRKINPSSVRYHVDGKGRIAYLILEL